MKEILAPILLAWIPLLASQANPLDLSKVSRNANWLLHMDFDSMRNSEIGSFMLDSMKKIPEAAERIEQMKKKYGVDINGFSYLTMSGTGEEHKGIAIMKGGIDTDMLVNFAKSQDSVEVSRIGKQKVFSSESGRHSMAFAPLKKGVIVGGPDTDYVSAGIELAKGKAPYYKGHNILAVLGEQIDNPSFLFFADVKGATKDNELNQRARQILEKVKAGGMVVGDDGGSISFVAVMEAADEENCKQVEAMVRGGMAMMDMAKAKDKRLEKVLEGNSIKRDGKMLWVKMVFSAEAIMDHLEQEMKKAA